MNLVKTLPGCCNQQFSNFCQPAITLILALFFSISDPYSMPPQRALETIGRTLFEQYEKWQPKVKKCFCDNRYYAWTRSRLYFVR